MIDKAYPGIVLPLPTVTLSMESFAKLAMLARTSFTSVDEYVDYLVAQRYQYVSEATGKLDASRRANVNYVDDDDVYHGPRLTGYEDEVREDLIQYGGYVFTGETAADLPA